MEKHQDARALVERITGLPGFTQAAGVEVMAASPGRVTLGVARRADLLQPNGYFHGGVIAGLADHAAGGAVTTALEGGQFAVTVNLQVSYLAPADGERLIARAHAVQAGRTIGVAQVEVSIERDGAESPCAMATVTLRAVAAP